MCDLLSAGKVKFLTLTLNALENIMAMDQDKYINLVKEAGGFDHLQRLEIHVNKKIREECKYNKKFWRVVDSSDNQKNVTKMAEN